MDDDASDEDEEPLVDRRARLAREAAPAAAKGLRRSERLQAKNTTPSGHRREVSDHVEDITTDSTEAHLGSQRTPTSGPRGDRDQTELRTSDFHGHRHGLSNTGVRGVSHGGGRVGDDTEHRPMEGARVESTEELHARLDREEEQRPEKLQREWEGRQEYMEDKHRIRDLETSAVVPDAGRVEHQVRTDPPAFVADASTPDTHTPLLSPEVSVDSVSAMGGDGGASEYGVPVVSNVIVGLYVVYTLQLDPPLSREPLDMEGDSGGMEEGTGADAEGDDEDGDAGRPARAHSAGSGRSS
ncbi:hypothetical protein CBR_g48473 [Chara braunii]|uniref:Uncharacterized protein n=1 Tax=Chara braunii TaxID=69332 RepID=A0A388M2T7_CHABU|nr:hypothetical protein CBR_g48473 [Chara braunii]|eukprot:GBG88861.1 hypothetical protein CBR_g48473 [Chara braunii]